MYRDGGLIPRGPSGHNYTFVMIGAHSTPFIVGAYMKGIRDFDVPAAYAGMRKNAFPGGLMGHGHYEHNSAVGGGIEDYIRSATFPTTAGPKAGSPSRRRARWNTPTTIGAWPMAQVLGKTEDAALFTRRAANYRNLFDPQTGSCGPGTAMVRGRRRSIRWTKRTARGARVRRGTTPGSCRMMSRV